MTLLCRRMRIGICCKLWQYHYPGNKYIKLSINVHFVDPADLSAWEAAITPKTKLLFGEIIGNPAGSILDIEKISEISKVKRIPFVVDNTFATPYLCRPIDWGATIVVHSATKFMGGHGNSIGGVVVDSGTFDFSGLLQSQIRSVYMG